MQNFDGTTGMLGQGPKLLGIPGTSTSTKKLLVCKVAKKVMGNFLEG